jgi:hypothetical protein
MRRLNAGDAAAHGTMAASDERFIGVLGPTNFTPATIDHGNAGAGEEKC